LQVAELARARAVFYTDIMPSRVLEQATHRVFEVRMRSSGWSSIKHGFNSMLIEAHNRFIQSYLPTSPVGLIAYKNYETTISFGLRVLW
jgi:hypothetical protein